MANWPNGSLQQLWEAVNKLKFLIAIITAAVIWVNMVNQDHKNQLILEDKLDDNIAIADDLLVRHIKAANFMRDSLITSRDLEILWRQSQNTHDKMWKEIDRLGGRSRRYHFPIGPMPEKYKSWMAWYVAKGNQYTGGE